MLFIICDYGCLLRYCFGFTCVVGWCLWFGFMYLIFVGLWLLLLRGFVRGGCCYMIIFAPFSIITLV